MDEETKTTAEGASNNGQPTGKGSQLVLMNIQDLRGKTFVIPAYQRGFRWRWQQIRELIDDLYEFCDEDNPQDIYCLQTITVIKTDKNDEKGNSIYEVVDGQQRLTAIWMLVAAYMCTSNFKPSKSIKLPFFTIIYYEKKKLNNYCKAVNKILNEILNHSSGLDPYSSILSMHADDIDSKFIYHGLEELQKYEYKKGNETSYYDDLLDDIFNCRKIRNESKKICIFWNEISNEQAGQQSGEGDVPADEGALDVAPQDGPATNGQNGSQNTQNSDWAIERFSNLNAGKIPLTESELIKAYFIDKLDKDKVDEFALQWEEFERGLSDDEFWGFLSSKEYETRIDLLFEIAYDEQNPDNKSHSLSLKVADELKSDNANTVWQKAVQCYQTLRDWYEDYFFYHMIGYIIAVDKRPSPEIIKKLYDEYKDSSKGEFKNKLKEHICEQELVKPIFDEEKNINLDNPENGLTYDGNKKSVKAVLLLFNVALLVNAYEINPDNATERFSFKLYKSTKNPIEIEHINPRHLEGKDAGKNKKVKWANAVLDIISKEHPSDKAVDEKEPLNDLREEVNRANWESQNNSLVERLEEAARLHDLSNLTLLDKKLNASYKDNFFSEKRKHILAARFGYPIPKSIDTGKDYYKQSVIFPGTMWVFLREYQEEPGKQNQALENDSADQSQAPVNTSDFWTREDREKYIETMEESISRLLATKGNNVPEAVKGKAEEVTE